VNISFSPTYDWVVLSKYDWTYIFPNTLQTIHNYDEFSYQFYNSTKQIYYAPISEYGFNINSTYSIISSKTDLNLGETELFRIDSLIFFAINPVNNINLTYSANQDINIMNNNYTARVFQGNISEFTHHS
jgi:hypothetical protein